MVSKLEWALFIKPIGKNYRTSFRSLFFNITNLGIKKRTDSFLNSENDDMLVLKNDRFFNYSASKFDFKNFCLLKK